MSAADGLVRNEEAAGASPAALTISGMQGVISWLHLSRKQDRREPRSERYRRLPPTFLPMPCVTTASTRLVAQKQSTRLITGRRRSVTCRDDHFFKPSTKGNPMKPVIRYQSQLL